MVETVLFYTVAAVVVIPALMLVTSRNVFHSALWLGLSLFGVAALFVMLDAYFLAGIQVLIYIGAVVVLMVFVINMTKAITGKNISHPVRGVIPALLASALGLALIILAVLKTNWNTLTTVKNPAAETAILGKLLLADFVVPFEVISILLLAALIGAIVIVSKDPEEAK